MIKNIIAILLAFILAVGVCVFSFRSFMGIDIFELLNSDELRRNTEQMPSQSNMIQKSTFQEIDVQFQEQTNKNRIQNHEDFSYEEVAIVNKYQNVLLDMEKDYEAKIDHLILTAITEYKKLPKQEKKNVMFTLGLDI